MIRLGVAPTIRVASKAIIIRDNHLLVTVNEGDFPTFMMCPGGGHEHGEDVYQALTRECREEIGCEVIVGDFAFMRDFIADRFQIPGTEPGIHQQEAFFFCELAPGAEPAVTSEGDTFQTGIAWLPLDSLAEHPLWPKCLISWLALPGGERPGYVGAVN